MQHLGLLKRPKKDWHVEITEIKTIQTLFAGAEGDRSQAIEEAQCNGFTHVFSIQAKQPKNWKGIILVALIGLAQIGLAALCTTVGLVKLTAEFMKQGLSDLMAAFKAAKGGGYFSWKDWGIQKVISIATTILCAGLTAAKEWLTNKIVPALKKIAPALKKVADKGRAIKKRFKDGFTATYSSNIQVLLKKTAVNLSGGILKELVQNLVDDALESHLIEHISAKIKNKVTEAIVETLEKNTWVQAAIALDVKSKSNYWQNILLQEGLKILHERDDEFDHICKEVFKGVTVHQLFSNVGEGLGGRVLKECIQSAPQIAESTYKALTLTKVFLTKFENKIQSKYKEKIEKAQEEARRQEQERAEQEQTQVAVQVTSAPPPIVEEEIVIPQIVINQDYKSDLRNYYYETPSNGVKLYSVFSSDITNQITNQIQYGILQPLAGTGVNIGVDCMLARTRSTIEEEKARYMNEGGGALSYMANQVGNNAARDKTAITNQAESAERSATNTHEEASSSSARKAVAPENQSASDEVRNNAQFDRTTAAHLANSEGRPVYVYEKNKHGKIKLCDIVGDELRGKPIRMIHTSPNNGDTGGHWEAYLTKVDIRNGKVLNPIDNSGRENCGFAAAACQIEGISSAAELRTQLANHIATSPHTPSLHAMQQHMHTLNAKMLMPGGGLCAAEMLMMQNDPHSFHNRLLLSSNKEYSTLTAMLQAADKRKSEEISQQLREMEIKAFEARKEALCAAGSVFKEIFYFTGGTLNALGNNLTLGILPRYHLSSNAFVHGQQLGDGVAVAASAATLLFLGGGMIGGGGVMMMVTSSGELVPIATPIMINGVATSTYGIVILGKAMLYFRDPKEYEGKKQSGKNEKHTNLKKKEKAEDKVTEAEADLENFRKNNRRMEGFKKKEKKLSELVTHWRNKAKAKGDTHSRKGKEKTSCMHTEHLYTVIIEADETRETFIEQVRTAKTKPNDVLFAWIEQAVRRGFIKGTDDPEIPFRDITVRENSIKGLIENGFFKGAEDPTIPRQKTTARIRHLKPQSGVFNVWELSFLIGQDFYVKDAIRARHSDDADYNTLRELIHCTVTFIKTATSVSSSELAAKRTLEAHDSLLLRKAEEKYAAYLAHYTRLKGVAELTKSITQERKQAEKQLSYWDARRKFLRCGDNRDAKAKKEYLYTVIFDYEYYHNTGAFTYQDTRRGTDINYVFYAWALRLLYDTWRPHANSEHKERMLIDRERILLMEKVSLGHYNPTPIAGLTNVWSTYFGLSDGMVKLTIIKTAPDEVMYEE